ncbi:hypothetical protein D3C81_2315810 [compost metagenome]
MAATDAEFGGGAFQVSLDRAVFDPQLFRHLRHGAAGQQAEADFFLAHRQGDVA